MAEMVWKFPEASFKGLGCGAACQHQFLCCVLASGVSPRARLLLEDS